jgi:hypothetical protein
MPTGLGQQGVLVIGKRTGLNRRVLSENDLFEAGSRVRVFQRGLTVTLGTQKDHFIAISRACTLKRIETVVFGALATTPETIELRNNADAVLTNGTVTISATAVAKEVDTASPTANNVFAAGDIMTVDVGGENANAVECEITFDFEYTV